MTDYKTLYEALERVHKADAAVAEGKERLWRTAHRALLEAIEDADAEAWQAAHRALLDIIEDQADDIATLKQKLSRQEEISMKVKGKAMIDGLKLAIDGIGKAAG